jgi:hypothetical protein
MLNLSHIQQYDTQHNWQSVVMLCVIIEPFLLSDVVPLTCQPEGEWGTLDSRKVKINEHLFGFFEGRVGVGARVDEVDVLAARD